MVLLMQPGALHLNDLTAFLGLAIYHTNKKEIEPQIMGEFSQNQVIHRLGLTSNEMFQSLLPTSYQRPLNNIVHLDSLNLLHYAHSRLERIHTFAFEKKICTNTTISRRCVKF